MRAKIIKNGEYWEIHIYNTLDELIDRICVTSIEIEEAEYVQSL